MPRAPSARPEVRKPRIGPVMREIAALVDALPGISKSDALRAVGKPVSGLGCWRPIERVLDAELVISEIGPRSHQLFRNKRARKLYYLRQELLHGFPEPAEAEHLRAQIGVLQAEQARTWTEG